MTHRIAVFGALSIVLVVGITIAGWAWLGAKPTISEVHRVLRGLPPFDVVAPESEHTYPVGAVDVLVTFPAEDRIDLASFRCLLNGRDVTDLLTVGSNGAAGSVYPLREGPNQLRVEVSARGLFSEDPHEDALEIPFRVRAASRLDRG